MIKSRRSILIVAVALLGLIGVAYAVLSPDLGQGARNGVGGSRTVIKLLGLGGGFLLTTVLLLSELSCRRLARLNAEIDRVAKTLEDAQQACRQAQTKLESVRRPEASVKEFFPLSPVPHALCTLREGRFVEANDSLLALLSLSREEVIGRTDAELGIWADSAARDRWWQQVGERKSVRDYECQLRSRSGESRTVILSAEPVEWEGEQCVLVAACDITERAGREFHLRNAQKMEAVGQLAAGFAHDFNNILCIVQGHTSLLLSEPGLDSESSASLKQVSTATERAANLTRQLLTFSRKQIMKPKTLDLNQLIHGLSNMLARILGEGVTLKSNFSSDVPPVLADTGMLEQVIMNLALNARDAMPRGGQLTVSTSAIVIDQHYARLKPEARVGQFTCIAVSDTGCGMEPAAVHRIFEPFFTTKDVGKGTGLGLATVYGIVKQHNGWIEVASQPGRGTTFKIFLPASPAAAASPSARPTPAAVLGGKETILVVEDEAGLLALVQGILERYGYRVLSAADGVQALKVWEEHGGKVDLLVTDMVMPEGITGQDLAEKLKARNPGLKVIYTSGYCADAVSDHAEDWADGGDFLQKPYRPHTLAQAVRSCLDRSARKPALLAEVSLS